MKLYSEVNSTNDHNIKKLKIKELVVFLEKYDIYKKDNLVFSVSNNMPFTSLIDSIYLADTEILENKEHNKNRIVLDGTRFRINVNVNNETIKSVWVHSPGNKSHPLISRLIRNTLNLYRE